MSSTICTHRWMGNMMCRKSCWVSPWLPRMIPLAWWGWHDRDGTPWLEMWGYACRTGFVSSCQTPVYVPRPSVYCISSPVYPQCVIKTGVYSKLTCNQENTVFVCSSSSSGTNWLYIYTCTIRFPLRCLVGKHCLGFALIVYHHSTSSKLLRAHGI